MVSKSTLASARSALVSILIIKELKRVAGEVPYRSLIPPSVRSRFAIVIAPGMVAEPYNRHCGIILFAFSLAQKLAASVINRLN